ncbi:hypothetical protein HIM_02220 [Hirsutella minnesotensis 3608]|nr:hypothetical protein HIM_02220 [Hirsutella minnesotensis 3608]
MVLLTLTPLMVEQLSTLSDVDRSDNIAKAQASGDDGCHDRAQGDSEPALNEPAVGNPISHAQIGSRVYIPPPPPKPEPSKEYKALMARLRREEAARAYQRMIDPPSRFESFNSRFPNAASRFAEVNRPTSAADLGDDEVTYSEVHRQVMLILNFLVSIIGVAATLWVVARWWSLPARIFLSMGGAIVVAIAEVGVYQAYVWRMGEAKSKQETVKEVKEVLKTWVVGQDEDPGEDNTAVLLKSSSDDQDEKVRRRRPLASAEAKPED